jgi:hypothetical protein
LAHTLDSRDVALSAIVLETASKKVFLSGELNRKDAGFANQQLTGTKKQTPFLRRLPTQLELREGYTNHGRRSVENNSGNRACGL